MLIRPVLLALGLLLCSPFCAAPGSADTTQQEATPVELTVRADEMSADLQAESVHAQGGVVAQWGEFVLHAEEITADLRSRLVTSPGQASLETPTGTVSGRDLSADLQQGTASVEGPSGRLDFPAGEGQEGVYSLYFGGQAASRTAAGAWRVQEARLSFCGADHPHQSLDVREATLSADGRLRLRGVSASLYGARIFSLPRYTVRVTGGPSGMPFPRLGYTSGYGVNAQINLEFPSGSGLLVLSEKRGLSGSAAARATRGQWSASLGAALKEDANNPFDSSLLLTRWPEVTAQWQAPLAGASVSLETSWGSLTEYPRKVRHERLLAAANCRWRSQPRPGLAVQWEVGLTEADYSAGFRQRTTTAAVRAILRLSRDTTAEVSYRNIGVSGSTPFRFDEVVVPREASVGLAGRLAPNWLARTAQQYDLRDGRFYDGQVTLENVQHCLAYGVTWSKRRGSLEFAIRLVPHQP